MSTDRGEAGDAARTRWETLWRSLTAEERREAALRYVTAAEAFPPGREAILGVKADARRNRI